MAYFVFLYDFLIIHFSVKNAFSGPFFRKQKVTRVFQWEKDINVVVIIALSSTKTYLSFLKFFLLAKIFGETFIIVVKSTFSKDLFSKESFISRVKQIKKNLRHGFLDERQLKMLSQNKHFLEYTLYLFAFQS